MKKVFGLIVFVALIMLLFPASAFADSFNTATGELVIDTNPPGNNLALAIANAMGVNPYTSVTSFTITSDVIYTLGSADQSFITSAFDFLERLDIASTVSFNADGALPVGDVMNGFCSGLTFLQSVNLPSAVYFGDNAFAGCTALSTVNLPSAASFDTAAFVACYGLNSITLPSATSFGTAAFISCINLSSVSLPLAQQFGDQCFQDCDSLASVSLPNATTFGNATFWGCTSLTSISLPSADSFLAVTFGNCTSLSSVSLPSITSMGPGTFSGCSQAIVLTLPTSVPTTDVNVFGGYTMNAASRVRIPEVSFNAYDNHALDVTGASGDGLWFGWTLDRIAAGAVANPPTGDRGFSYVWLVMILPLLVAAYIIGKRKMLHN
ncbi:MAG: leucine-rich repeat domain-containing protein [Eubacteriales bacterium]